MVADALTVQGIVERCTRYSGWLLEAKFETIAGTRCLVFEEPGRQRSRLVLAANGFGGLKEVRGRLSWWAISYEEQRILAEAIARGEL